MKGVYKFVRELWKKPKANLGKEFVKERLVGWRKEPALVRIDRPTRIDRARSLGYRAKQGIIVVRARVKKGIAKRPMIKGGRRPKRNVHLRIARQKSKQRVAEERTARRYKSLEVLNSYWVGKDGKNEWFEVILIDPTHPVIVADPKFKWVHNKQHKGRAFRGKTSAGQRTRGLRI